MNCKIDVADLLRHSRFGPAGGGEVGLDSRRVAEGAVAGARGLFSAVEGENKCPLRPLFKERKIAVENAVAEFAVFHLLQFPCAVRREIGIAGHGAIPAVVTEQRPGQEIAALSLHIMEEVGAGEFDRLFSGIFRGKAADQPLPEGGLLDKTPAGRFQMKCERPFFRRELRLRQPELPQRPGSME